MPPIFDAQFDDLAAETHANLAARTVTAAAVVPLASTVVPFVQAAAWFAAMLLIEAWCWIATRPQFRGERVGFVRRLSFLGALTALVGGWMGLVVIYWFSGTATGELCAMITLMCIIGFAQLFASRSPLGFAICGVAPAAVTFGVIALAPPHPSVQTGTLVCALSLGLAFAVAGARQTYQAARRHLETRARLDDSEDQARVLADHVTDLIGRRTLDGKWLYVSPSARTVLGYSPEEFAARDPATFVHPEDLAAVQAGFVRLTAGQGPQTVEHRAMRKDGAVVWLETSYSLIRDRQTGAPRELVSATRDVSARKALEGELIQARVSAEAAAAAKSDFLANMTHELRTPLNAIVGFSGVLKGSKRLTRKDAHHVRLIQDASSTLLAVVNGVLDFSKLESGGLALDARPFDPAEMVRSAVRMVEEQAAGRGLYLRLSVDEETARLSGDAPRLQQVVLNLLSNAIKFTLDGGVEVSVESQALSDGLRRLRVVVTDTGVGVPVDKVDAIFERFAQADASISRTFGGTGLGLAISRRIIELMGGRIDVASVEGQGSCFWFEVDLPLADAAHVDPMAEESALDRPIRLLLVEDNEVNRQLVEVLLEPFGVDMDIAVNGAEAVEAVSASRYDVVLMDVQMPVMDGLSATRAIRELADPAARALPIIAMTANVLPEHVAKCREAGMNDHVGKPINPADLLQALAAWTAPGAEASEAAAG